MRPDDINRPLRAGAALFVLAAFLLLLPSSGLKAQEGRLDDVERALQEDRAKAQALSHQAQALKDEIKALRRDMVAAARQAQDLEERLSALERSLKELEHQKALKTAALEAKHDQLVRTLGALQRIALRPPEAAIATPGSPIDTLRGARLLSVAVPAIERRAGALRGELDSLEKLSQKIALEQANIAKATGRLTQEQQRLAVLVERKRGLEDLTSAEYKAASDRVRKLAQQARTLRDLVDRLETDSRKRAERKAREAVERKARRTAEALRENQQALLSPPADRTPLAKPGNVRAFPERPNAANLVMPARGRLVSYYGQKDGNDGTEAKGISILTRHSAQVVAPYDGKVAYAGEFRRYGPILIIEHGERYHTLLAGFDRIDAVVGQWVLAGEPIGTTARPENGDPVLYLELRRSGQPINPLPWLATTNDKVQG